MQDVALPLFNFGNNPFQFPPAPPAFSVIWASDTDALCARDPENLYLEFSPYSANLLTSALKKLWTRNCECAPVLGLWSFEATFKITNCNAQGECSTDLFPNQANQEGAAIGVIVEETSNAQAIEKRIKAYRYDSGYQSLVTIFSQSVPNNPGSAISVTYSQRQIADGCFPTPQDDPPIPPGELPTPTIPTPPISIPPIFIIEPPKPFPIFGGFPDPEECCDCC